MKKIIGTVVLVILIVLALFFLFRKSREGEEAIKTVTVQRGTVAEKALAVGTIEPENEIKVKSTISGIVKDLFFKVGDTVEKGKPLFSVSPNPTPVEYTEALRAMEVSKESFEQAQRERNRKRELFAAKIISPSEMDSAESLCREAELRFRVNREKYELLESGRIKTAGREIDSIVRSPIKGVILSQAVFQGDPVVPLTNYQPGTELCAMADISRMLFKGNVDEIDVGKMSPGMNAEIVIGAIPGSSLPGRLLRISPKATKDGNANLFAIEVLVSSQGPLTLRAGYSATASVKIRERNGVLVIPERLVHTENGVSTVEIKKGDEIVKKTIKTGLSDGLQIEVIEGLKEGSQIVERPPREIE